MPDYEGLILSRAETWGECGYCEYWSPECPGRCYVDDNELDIMEHELIIMQNCKYERKEDPNVND